MKKFILSFALLLAMILLRAQPQFFTYQTLVRDSFGAVITDQVVSFRLSIRQDNVNGLAVYREDHVEMTNGFGLVTLEIGNGNPVSGSFQAINWAQADHFLEVGLDINGGSTFMFMGVTQLMSVPYALHAKTVDDIHNNLLPPTITTWDASSVDQYGATLNGLINPEGFSTSTVFEWGHTSGYGNMVEAVQNLLTGSDEVAVHAVLSGLQPGTLYHFRLKATNAVGVTFSEDATFTTLISVPQVATAPAADIGTSTATLVGNIVYDGGDAVSARGFFWGLSPDLQTTGLQITAGSGSGEFTAGLTGLSENTIHYFMAYATNSEGTSYGNVVEFSTDPLVEVIFRVNLSESVAFGSLNNFDTTVHTVNITGSMMNWAEPGMLPAQQQLTRISDDPLIYSKTLQLDAGDYAYKFFTDALGTGWAGGEWGGEPNRMLTVQTDTIVDNAWAIYCAMPVPPVAGNNGPSLCEGDDIYLTVDSGTSWYWTGPDGFTSWVQNPVIPSSPYSMGGLYSVFVTDENGCSAYATTSVSVTSCLTLPNMTSTCSEGYCEYTCWGGYFDCDGVMDNGCESYLPGGLQATSNSPVTIGNMVQLGIDGGTSWLWTGPMNYTSTQQYPVFNAVSTFQTGYYTVILNDGCFGAYSEYTVYVVVTE